LQQFAAESRVSHQNAQKLTDNMKKGQIFDIVIKYSLFGSW